MTEPVSDEILGHLMTFGSLADHCLATELLARRKAEREAKPVAWLDYVDYEDQKHFPWMLMLNQEHPHIANPNKGVRIICYTHPAPAQNTRTEDEASYWRHGTPIPENPVSVPDGYLAESTRTYNETQSQELSPAWKLPDGYVLVPVEPTEEMLVRAAVKEGWNDCPPSMASRVYKAMLSARPKP